MTITAARAHIAAAITAAIPGADVRPRPPIATPRAGDGWVVVRRVAPGPRFGTGVAVTVEAVVVAGHDEASAEAYVDTHSAALLAAVADDPELPASAVSVEPQALIVGTTAAPLYALVLTATIETE